MSHGITAAIAAALLLASPVAAPAQSQSLAALETNLQRGDRIQVIDRDGGTVEGDFDGVSAASLRVIRRRVAVTLLDAQIVGVRRRHREPDGVLIGLGFGAATGLGFVMLRCDSSSERADCLRAGSAVMLVPCAVAGALIDRAFRRFDLILDRGGPSPTRLRVSPVVTGRHAGVVVTLVY